MPNKKTNKVTEPLITDGYFETIDSRILQGRKFKIDDSNAPNVAIVNNKFAQKKHGLTNHLLIRLYH
jgi:hypothetical protein